MTGLIDFYIAHPFWLWLSVAAAFLAIEVGTGTGWLLWPAASAAVIGVVALLLPTSLPVEIALFAVLTIASTYLARRFLRPALAGPDPDLNDPTLRLLGRPAEVVTPFENGRGRVFVDGKEWAARTEDEAAPETGARVSVVGVHGAVLTVR
ncbi:MAG: NfeD family protein [Caulobacter sp.]